MSRRRRLHCVVVAVCASALAAAERAPAQEEPRPRRVVRITAPDGTGIPGVRICGAGGAYLASTGPDGTAEVARSADEILEVSYAGDLTRIAAGAGRSEFVAESLPRLTVSALRVDDGRPIRPVSGKLAFSSNWVVELRAEADTGRMGRSAVAVDWNPAWAEFGGSQSVEVVTGGAETGLMGRASVGVPFYVPARVRRLEVTVPIRARCRLRLRVRDDRGRPVQGAEAASVTWAGYEGLGGTSAPHVPRSASDDEGLLELDVPHFAGDAVVVQVVRGMWWERHLEGESGAIALRPTDVAESPVTLRSAEPGEGPAEGAGRGLGGSSARRAPRQPADLVVLALDAGGRPMPRAALCADDGQEHHALADSQGIARFAGLEAGGVRVRFADHSVRPRTTTVIATAGATDADFRLTEPEGRNLDVQVVHEDGSPAKFAQVVCTVSGREFRPLIDGAWRSALTDAAGRLRIPGAPQDPVTLTATYGSRRVTVTVARGADGSVRIVLPSAI